MDPVTSQHKLNIYDLFNNEYRKCTITFEDLLNDNPDLLDEYISVKKESLLLIKGCVESYIEHYLKNLSGKISYLKSEY